MDWQREIIELHRFFQAYFLAETDSIERFEAVLEPDFTMIGPDGAVSDRDQVVEAVRSGHGHTTSLEIETSDHTLLAERPGLVVARYVETHHLSARSNRRITTVVFTDRPELPRGVGWLHAHETWLDRGAEQRPLCTFVERHGLDHPESSLDAMPALTRFRSCEFAIRPFLDHHLEKTRSRLHLWAHVPDATVRRLASRPPSP